MYRVGLALCRGPQVQHEALQLSRQTKPNCTDLQLNIMVILPLQSKEVTFHLSKVSYLLERNSISLIYLYKFRGHSHTYKMSTDCCYMLRITAEMYKTEP